MSTSANTQEVPEAVKPDVVAQVGSNRPASPADEDEKQQLGDSPSTNAQAFQADQAVGSDAVHTMSQDMGNLRPTPITAPQRRYPTPAEVAAAAYPVDNTQERVQENEGEVEEEFVDIGTPTPRTLQRYADENAEQEDEESMFDRVLPLERLKQGAHTASQLFWGGLSYFKGKATTVAKKWAPHVSAYIRRFSYFTAHMGK